MRIARAAPVALALAAATVPLASQSAPPFKSAVQLVEVDVRVFDRQGRFVPDLRPEDVQIFESGTAQVVRSLVLVSSPGAGRASGASAEAGAAPSPHVWVFYVDDRSSVWNTEAQFYRARTGLRQFIQDHLPEGDLGGIVYLDRLIGNRFTSVRERLLEDIDEMVTPGSESPVLSPLGEDSETLDTLDRLLAGLSQVRGLKTLVLMSDGVPLQAGRLRRVVRKAIGSGVRIYGIDTRGVPDHGMAPFPSDGLNSLAIDTGGEVLFWHNDLKVPLMRVSMDTSTYYVLAYEPRNTKFDGKFRSIKVGVKRPDVRVRARKGYFAVDPATLRAARPAARR